MEFFKLMAKSMVKTPSDSAGKDLPYIAKILISSQIYAHNLKSLAEKNLQHVADLLISRQIHTRKLI